MQTIGIRLSFAGLVLGLAVSAAEAHAVWIAQRTGELTVVYGHGAADDPYAPAKVKAISGFTASGASAGVESVAREKNLIVQPAPDAALLTIYFDNGYWTERANGKWENVGKSVVPDAKSAGHYVKHALAILHPLPEPARPTDLKLQILPLADPLALRAGQELPVRVLLDGKPLAGATLIADYTNEPDGKGPVTDAHGEARVIVSNNGLNVIALSHAEKLEGDPDADERGHMATLSFMLFDEEE